MEQSMDLTSSSFILTTISTWFHISMDHKPERVLGDFVHRLQWQYIFPTLPKMLIEKLTLCNNQPNGKLNFQKETNRIPSYPFYRMHNSKGFITLLQTNSTCFFLMQRTWFNTFHFTWKGSKKGLIQRTSYLKEQHHN